MREGDVEGGVRGRGEDPVKVDVHIHTPGCMYTFANILDMYMCMRVHKYKHTEICLYVIHTYNI